MPRAKRAKQYRKLMQQFGMTFGFRSPYQVLVDAELLADACRFKMDLVKSLKQTLSDEVKPMITQCSMRHLYAKKDSAAIELAKTFERRRCGHHPEQYPEPLSTLECLGSVVDPKDAGTNKNCYVIASNELEVRASMRQIRGVPLIYITRSVMIMEPMASGTVSVRAREERGKLRAEIKKPGGKRKREDDDDDEDAGEAGARGAAPENKKKNMGGAKGPNPLSVKKTKKAKPTDAKEYAKSSTEKTQAKDSEPKPDSSIPTAAEGGNTEDKPKRKRKRKHKAPDANGETAGVAESEMAQAEEAED